MKNIFNNNLNKKNSYLNKSNNKVNSVNKNKKGINNKNFINNDFNINIDLKNSNNSNKIEISKKSFKDSLKNYSIPFFKKREFQFIKIIGQGSFGKIYLVKEIKENKEYAVKIIYCKGYYELLKYLEEFEFLYKISNDNIIKVYKYNIVEKELSSLLTELYLYLLMEKAECDWEQEIEKRRKNKQYYTVEHLFLILNQLVSGLTFLQENKIAHRDIKPQNILIFPQNIYKITDLGEAKMNLNLKNEKQKQTFVGSELFMSPLLYNGLRQNKNRISHNPFKSDVYSLGLCFLYAITLNLNVIKLIRELKYLKNKEDLIKRNVKDLPKYPHILWGIVFKMLEYEEKNRYDFIELGKHLPKFNYEKY